MFIDVLRASKLPLKVSKLI